MQEEPNDNEGQYPMTPVLKPYPAYKPSGVEWLGHIPAHWVVRRLKLSVANSTEQTNKRNEHEIYLALEHVESWTGRYSDAGPDVIFDSQVKRFRAGDVLFGKLRPYLAKVVRPDRDGVCVGEFLVLRPRGCAMSPEYLKWLLRTKPVINAINASTYGTKMPRTNWQFIGGMKQPLPPLPEQEAIAHYLGYVERRIRRYIDAKQKLVGLLKELKQATIYEAVTRGLDPDVPLKPSGVEWLGHIPAHWEVLPNRVLFIEVTERDHPEEQMLSVTIAKGVIRQKELLANSSKKDSSNLDKSAYKLVHPGDIVYNKMRAWQGAVGVSEYQGIVSPAYVVQRPRAGVHSRYVHYLLRTAAFAKEAEQRSYGIASDMWSLRPKHFKIIYICLPPLPEQEAIAEYLDKEITNIDTTLNNTRREIELLQEYRTVLIADVVSGQVDVRDVAANLPDDDDIMADDSDAISEEVQK